MIKSHMSPSTKIICFTFSMRSSHKFWFHVFFLFWPADGREGWERKNGREGMGGKDGREGWEAGKDGGRENEERGRVDVREKGRG